MIDVSPSHPGAHIHSAATRAMCVDVMVLFSRTLQVRGVARSEGAVGAPCHMSLDELQAHGVT